MDRLDLKFRHWLAMALIGAAFAAGALSRWLPGSGLWSRWPSSGIAVYERDVEPVLTEHCYDCHGDGVSKGDVALDQFATAQERNQAMDFWASVHHSIEAGLMPPAEKGSLEESERARVLAWIERDVFRLDPRNPDPGQVVIRRMNRQEYRNSIRELFGDLPLDPA